MLCSDSEMLRIVLLNWGNGKHDIKQIIPCVMGLKFCLVKKQVCVFGRNTLGQVFYLCFLTHKL